MFEDYTYERLLEDVLNNAPEDIDTRQGSIFYDAVSGILLKVAKLYTDLDLVVEMVSVVSATGEALDTRAGEYGITRLAPTRAKYLVTFEGVMPQTGERFYNDGRYFVLREGEENGQPIYYLEAEAAGSGSNDIYKGTPAVPVNNIEGLISAEFGALYENGSDAEEDESLRTRVQEKIAGPAENGNKQHYKTWCESIDGVGRARIFPLWNGPNTVKAVLIDGTGQPCGPQKVEEVQNYIDPATRGYTATVGGRTYTVGDGLGEGVANLGAHFTATGAIPLTVNVSFTAELASGATKDAARQDAEAAIEEYFKELVLDTAEATDIVVRVSAVGAILSGLQTVLDYSDLKLNGAAVNITPGEDGVPVIGGGGYFVKFYEKYYASNYEELITYYPRFYRDVFEMVEILKAHGRIADGMEENIEQAYLNGFIDYADEATIAKLERFLEIGLNRSRTLEERRRLVKSYFVGFGKISATLIKQMIGAYTNAPVDCRFEPFDDEGNNMLFIDFQRSGNETIYMSDILMLLSKKLPAHIAYRPEIVYRFPVVVGRRRKYYRYGYDLCGTKPDTALLGLAVTRDMVTQQEHSNTRITYKNADEENELAGTYPETTTQGQYLTWDVATTQEHENSVFRYEEAGEHQQIGKHPGTAFLGEAVRAALGVEAGHENSVTGYEITGTKPDTVLLAAAHAGTLAVEERRENTLTEYEATGIKPEAAAIARNLGQMTAISQKVGIYTTNYEKAAETAHTGAEPGITTVGNSKVIDAGAGVTATECSVDYTPCGTTFTQS